MHGKPLIGRLGALAVTLGVGAMLATTPGTAFAEPGASTSSASSSAGEPAAREGAQATDASSPGAGSASTDSGHPRPEQPAGPARSGGIPPIESTDSPGGADSPRTGEAGEGEDADGDVAGGADPDVGGTPTAAEPEVPTTGEGADNPVHQSGIARHIPAPPDEVLRTARDASPQWRPRRGLPASEPNRESVAVPEEPLRPSPESAYTPVATFAAVESSPAAAAASLTGPVATALAGPLDDVTSVIGTVVTVFSSVTSAALRPWLALVPGAPESPGTALWVVLAWARRDIGQAVSSWPSRVADGLADLEHVDLPDPADPGSWLPWAEGAVSDAAAALRNAVIPVFFNRTPIAAPQQVAVTVTPGQASAPIAFTAEDPDGDRMTFTVNERGNPGAPRHGTVTVDQAMGTFTYTPDSNFVQGTDTFTVAVQDDTNVHFHALDFIFGTFSGHRDIATVTVFLNGARTDTISGDFTVLSYNVADLPEPLSSARYPRSAYSRMISGRLNAYDVVNMQEDAAYHTDIVANSLFPFQTAPIVSPLLWGLGVPFTDGLNTLSAYEMTGLERVQWQSCTLAGGNCLTPKGFSYSQMHLPGGQVVDMYNLHADTDRYGTVQKNLAQLTDFIQQHSAGHAVIITGDFNTQYSTPGSGLPEFLSDNQLTDAKIEVGCNTRRCDGLDKFLYRSGSGVTLKPTEFRDESSKFENDEGRWLSDSPPTMIRFGYVAANLGPLASAGGVL